MKQTQQELWIGLYETYDCFKINKLKIDNRLSLELSEVLYHHLMRLTHTQIVYGPVDFL